MSSHPADEKSLRSFGWLMGGVLTLVGSVLLYNGKVTGSAVFGGLAMVFFIPALVSPGLLAGIHSRWMKFADVIGRFNAKVILGLMYTVIFTFVRALLFVLRKDLLQRKIDPARESYWCDREPVGNDPKRYEQQF
ncbi:hypothetical protein UR09_05420 [Candidatus Nitromaritima sp. SCGC AAA799-A02]|nr:hypothetical protein UR09_05420 [Candidatus Nitromaritima sp. SCGC AAA799-A02]KMP11501.1 hypothetical protein UZ36_04175 [Candidatus Nitromaritima sp. SCGC AAA799-C22]